MNAYMLKTPSPFLHSPGLKPRKWCRLLCAVCPHQLAQSGHPLPDMLRFSVTTKKREAVYNQVFFLVIAFVVLFLLTTKLSKQFSVAIISWKSPVWTSWNPIYSCLISLQFTSLFLDVLSLLTFHIAAMLVIIIFKK